MSTFERIFVGLFLGYVAREAGMSLGQFLIAGVLFTVAAFVFSAVGEGIAAGYRRHKERNKND